MKPKPSYSNTTHQWFVHLFDSRKNANGYIRCFECGKPMHESTWKELTTCYSHILSKKTYPNYAGLPENVEIVHPNCHHLYTINPQKAINQYNKYLQLKQQYYNEQL